MNKGMKKDIEFALKSDVASRNKRQIRLTYFGVKALNSHRRANFFYRHKFFLLADYLSYRCKVKFGIDIHPNAQIADGVFIDHGVGVVIGETAIIEKNVIIYQGVTIGGTGKENGKRHPTIKEGTVISAGAKILGGFTIGKNCKIGAGSVVLHEIPDNCTVVGVPGRIVKQNGEKIQDLKECELDPILEDIIQINERLLKLENKENYENL